MTRAFIMNNVTPLLTPAEDDPNVRGDKVVAGHCRPEMMENTSMANKQQGTGKQGSGQGGRQQSGMQGSGQQSVTQQGLGKDVKKAGIERNTLGQSTLGQTEHSYWRSQYQNEPYVAQGEKFDEYAPAYRTGYEGRAHYAGQRFEDVQDNLKRDYENNRGDSTLGWDKARQACRAAWDHSDKSMSSQTDRQQGR